SGTLIRLLGQVRSALGASGESDCVPRPHAAALAVGKRVVVAHPRREGRNGMAEVGRRLSSNLPERPTKSDTSVVEFLSRPHVARSEVEDRHLLASIDRIPFEERFCALSRLHWLDVKIP